MDQNDTNSGGQTRGIIIVGFVIVAVLILFGLFLPPISLGERLGLGSSDPTETGTEESAETGTFVNDRAGTATMPEGVALALSNGSADIAAMSPSDFIVANSAAQPSDNHSISGDVYTVSAADSGVRGQVALPLPTDASNLSQLDLYGWNGSDWSFIPSQIDVQSKQIVSVDRDLPQAFALMETKAPEDVAVTGYVSSGAKIPTALLPLVSDIVITGLKLNNEGALDGEIVRQADGAYNQWIQVSNVGPVTDQVALTTLLGNIELQQDQIDQLVSLAETGEYQGIELNYQQIPENQVDAFNTFARNLADALHAQGLQLAITLGVPTFTGSTWNSGGQDWATLGEIADVVNIDLPLNPTEYDQDDAAARLLTYVTRQIDRSKLRSLYNAAAVDGFGETYSSLSNNEALANFGELQFVQGSEDIQPNETIEVALSGNAQPLEWDGDSLTYRYSYDKDGQTHNVWLGSEAALNHRLQQSKIFNLSGLGIRGLETIEDGNGYAAVLENLKGDGVELESPGAAIAWTVRDEDNSVVASESGNELAFTWEPGDIEGEYTIHADFALGDNVANLGAVTVAVKSEEDVIAEAVTDETTDTGEDPETPAEEEQIPSEETTTEEPASIATFSGDGDAVVTVGANVRTGPGLTYGTLADGADPGTELDLIGRNSDSSWLNVVLEDGREGWIFASLVTINPSVDVASLEVIEVAPPAAVTASTEGGDDGESAGDTPAAAAPPPVAVAPITNTGFELGGQSHSFGNPQLMSYAGMNWIKFQHKWGPGDDPSAVAGRIQQAHANGFKVLLSIPGQNTYPDSIDFNAYVEFLRGVAALGPDAIEVWNEENIDFEWPAGQIDPAAYVNNMLAPAYNAIKGANPSVMVVSGAPAPTGYFGGGCSANGCDDNAYLAGMAAAGAANYLDCVGVHFNAGATPPSQASGHPAGSNHYSWYFQPTLDLYYSSLGKPVCFTELGYLSGEDFGGVPSRFSWAGDTSVAEHAQWLAEAISLAANSGKTRLAIIFNVDFTMYGDDPQAGYALIRPDGSCPACETLRQVMGG